MRLLFSSTHGLGHALPLLPFAHAAREAGHDVLLAGPAPIAAVADRAGLDYAELAWPDDEPLAVARRQVAELDGVERIQAAIAGLFVTTYGGAALPSALAIVERWRPDVILYETAEAAAPIAGEAHGVPTVRVGVALATPYEAWWLGMGGPALDALRATVGVAPDPGAERASWTPLLTRVPPALDVGQGDTPPDVRRFRDDEDAADGADAALGAWWPGVPDDAPLVPISFGTMVPTDGHYPGVYRDAIDAVADLPIRVLVTVGRDADPAALGALAPNVHVERWVPIAAALRDAAAFVTHGGAGTTLAALAAGVPMALLPISADQPLNARLVAELGAGVALEAGPADAPRLGEAVAALLADDRYRRVAQRVAAEIRELPPVAAAIDRLEDLAAAPALSPAGSGRR